MEALKKILEPILFLSLQQKITLGLFLFLLAVIPIATLLVSQRTRLASKAASPEKRTFDLSTLQAESTPSSTTEKLKQLLSDTKPDTTSLPPPTTPAQSLAFGPTLNMKIKIEGRPEEKQAAKIFVGLASGPPQPSPTYLLTFTVDFSSLGVFEGLSLAGLNVGSTYTAYLKGPAQLVTASSFTMSNTIAYLNNNQSLLLLSGDLNDDNVINTADYSIAKAAYGTTPQAPKWNEQVDFNLDGIINGWDLRIISKNLGKTGLSGAWYSPPSPATNSATPSGGLVSPMGAYWMWVPRY